MLVAFAAVAVLCKVTVQVSLRQGKCKIYDHDANATNIREELERTWYRFVVVFAAVLMKMAQPT
eukprot:11942674-Ditylum_brightwellii.AAC.1